MADSCSELSAQIAALNAQISRLNILTEAQVRQIVDSILNPKITEVTYKLEAVSTTAKTAIDKTTSFESALRQMQTAISGITKTAGTALSTANEALEANNAVGGLKGLVEGLKGRIGALGDAIARVEKAAGDALIKAAKAIGVSEEALLATGRLAGKVAEIFNIIGTFATLAEQFFTLKLLGERIDAVEAGLEALGASVSGILGKLLGLQNRISNNEATISQVKDIAIDARGIGEAANLRAGTALIAVRQAQGTADTALGNAKQSQLTADGAVRNAATANENATTAYKKATEAQGIGEQAKRIADDALGKAGEGIRLGLTAIALYQGIKFLRGLPGVPGIPGAKGDKGDPGIPGAQGAPGITTVVTLPGTPGANGAPGRPGSNGLPGRNGKDGKDGKDVNPIDLASLRALIVQQHTQTRLNSTSQHNVTRVSILTPIMTALAPILAFLQRIYDAIMAVSNAAILALLKVVDNKLGAQVTGGLSKFIETIAKNTYIEKALAVMTFAATMHNALMLSNNLAQTLGTIIDQTLGFILPKGLDGNPISIGNVLGKAAHEVIATTIGEANYTQITEDWAKANRIYQATINVFNSITNATAAITAGMEVIGGNVAKIGNGLKVWGVLGERVYSWMNPQPNFHGRFFTTLTSAQEAANTIQAVVAVPVSIKDAVVEVNSARTALQASLNQEDPKDKNGHPLTDALGNPLKHEPGVTVPDPTKTVLAEQQAKADSRNIIEATLEDIFDGGGLMGNYIPPRDEQGKQLPPTSDIATGNTLSPSNPTVIAGTPLEDKLPDNFQPFEHLQQVYIPQHNAVVKKYFADLGDDWKPNVATARSSLRVACTMLDSDNQAIMSLRHHLLFDLLGYSRKNLAIIYGSKFDTAPPVAGHPQLFLYFSQDAAAKPIDEPLIEHEKSCRLMNFSCSSEGIKPAITKADMTAIANEIKTLFLDNKKGITYTTGNKSASYTDPDHGFAKGNYLLVKDKADAVNIYSKMCNAIDVPYKGDSHILLNDPDKASTTTATAGKTTILGKQRNNRRYRPVAILRFRYAYISLGNLISPVFLIDTTLRNKSLVEWL